LHVYKPWEYIGSNHTLIANFSNIYILGNGNTNTFSGTSQGYVRGNSNHQYHNIWFTNPGSAYASLTGPIYADTVYFYGNGGINNSNNIGVVVFERHGILFSIQTIGTLTFLDNGDINGSSTVDSLLLAPGMKYIFQ